MFKGNHWKTQSLKLFTVVTSGSKLIDGKIEQRLSLFIHKPLCAIWSLNHAYVLFWSTIYFIKKKNKPTVSHWPSVISGTGIFCLSLAIYFPLFLVSLCLEGWSVGPLSTDSPALMPVEIPKGGRRGLNVYSADSPSRCITMAMVCN